MLTILQGVAMPWERRRLAYEKTFCACCRRDARALRTLRQGLAHVHLAAGAVAVANDDELSVLRLGNALALQVVVAYDGFRRTYRWSLYAC